MTDVVQKNPIIAGAVARGWCHKPNEHKTMDVDLATAITDEVCKVAKVNAPTIRQMAPKQVMFITLNRRGQVSA